MGNDMFNDEQLAHAEIVQKETEDALTWWKSRALAAEAERDRMREACSEFVSQYGPAALACRYDNSCDDSGRDPRCVPCALRAALGEEGSHV